MGIKNAIIGLACALLVAVPLAGCTDASRAKFGALGDPARVTCHSGGVVVFDDFSTGKVQNSNQSDGYYFMSSSTGRLVEVSGDCRIDYGAKQRPDWQPVYPK